MKTGLSVIHQPPTFWQPPSRTYTHPPTLPQTSFFPFPSSVGRIQSKSPGNPLFCQQPAPNDSFFFTTLHPILCFYLRIPRFCLSDECTNYLFFFFRLRFCFEYLSNSNSVFTVGKWSFQNIISLANCSLGSFTTGKGSKNSLKIIWSDEKFEHLCLRV